MNLNPNPALKHHFDSEIQKKVGKENRIKAIRNRIRILELKLDKPFQNITINEIQNKNIDELLKQYGLNSEYDENYYQKCF